MIESTTVLFGLPGVQVTRVSGMDDGTRIVEIATDEATAAACPSCGVFSTSVKARVTTTPKDIPYGDGRILLRWNKTRWRCREDYCERGSFTEAIEQVPRRARTTGRLRTQIGAAIGAEGGGTTAAVVTWLTGRTPEFREAIEYLAIDPVVDHFHLVALANLAVTKTRRLRASLVGPKMSAVRPKLKTVRPKALSRGRLGATMAASMWSTPHPPRPRPLQATEGAYP